MAFCKTCGHETYGCPECGNTDIFKDRVPYCGPGDTNYIECKCRKCGHEWTETD